MKSSKKNTPSAALSRADETEQAPTSFSWSDADWTDAGHNQIEPVETSSDNNPRVNIQPYSRKNQASSGGAGAQTHHPLEFSRPDSVSQNTNHPAYQQTFFSNYPVKTNSPVMEFSTGPQTSQNWNHPGRTIHSGTGIGQAGEISTMNNFFPHHRTNASDGPHLNNHSDVRPGCQNETAGSSTGYKRKQNLDNQDCFTPIHISDNLL